MLHLRLMPGVLKIYLKKLFQLDVVPELLLVRQKLFYGVRQKIVFMLNVGAHFLIMSGNI